MPNLNNTYRDHVADCRRRAANATNENEKLRWQRMADEWQKLLKPHLDPARNSHRADDGLQGITYHRRKPDLLKLITLLSDADLRKVEEKLPGALPFNRPNR